MRGAAHTLYTWQGRTETADRFEDAYWDLDWHLYELQWERIDWRFKVLDELTAMLAKLLRKEMWFADYSVVGELGLKVECVAPRRLLFAFCKARLTALRAGCGVWGVAVVAGTMGSCTHCGCAFQKTSGQAACPVRSRQPPQPPPR